ncbi:MAG: F0F1 ATP synthase subunit epsilon [Phycisphaerae bacterium]|nr:F0F1 ATP synthase subunit epsilon [Phycisphaerae bacterium]
MAKTKQIDVVVITPERQVLEETVDEAVIPAHDGELGVLNLRAPLMCELGIGQLRYSQDGQSHRVFIDGGFAQVLDNRVTVLTSAALPAEYITAEMVDAAEHAIDDHQGHEAEARLAGERAQRRLSVLRGLKNVGT